MTPPTPSAWTLRFKHSRTTVLLHTDPLTPFATLKTTLLHVLRETQPSGHLNNTPLPTSPSQITLGRPVDINDPSKGFVTGEWERGAGIGIDIKEEEDVGKGKGKARSKSSRSEKGGSGGVGGAKDCPKGAGLRDGSVLAFKWGERSEDGDENELELEGEKWDVVIPAYEDQYGVENLGDLGGRKEFVG